MAIGNHVDVSICVQNNQKLARKGLLDGVTILRYAQVYEDRGGMEDYLRYLNRILSERSAMTTILVHLTCKQGQLEGITETSNGSRLVRVPLFVRKEFGIGGGSIQKPIFARLAAAKRIIRSGLMVNPRLRATITSLWRRRQRMRRVRAMNRRTSSRRLSDCSSGFKRLIWLWFIRRVVTTPLREERGQTTFHPGDYSKPLCE